MRRRVAGLVLIVGGAAAALIGRQERDLPAVVLAIGVVLLLAWFVERGNRFGLSGAVVTGLGAGLVLAEHVTALGEYRDPLIFGGIGLGLLLAAQRMQVPLRGAGLGLLSVAIAETALQVLPSHIDAPSVFAAFREGWGFGALLMAEGVAVVLGVGRGRGAGHKR